MPSPFGAGGPIPELAAGPTGHQPEVRILTPSVDGGGLKYPAQVSKTSFGFAGTCARTVTDHLFTGS